MIKNAHDMNYRDEARPADQNNQYKYDRKHER